MWIVVGIGGVTGGGKTTLTNALRKDLSVNPENVKVIAVDNYFLPKEDDSHKWIDIEGVKRINYELNSSMDMMKIHKELTDTLSEEEESNATKIFIIDGHTILNCPAIGRLCDLRYYFTLSRDECKRRRRYNDKAGYFDVAVWPSYVAHKTEVEAFYEDAVVYLDGTVDPEETLKRVKIDILNFILKRKT